MGNHSNTGELLEEVRLSTATEKKSFSSNNLNDEFGNTLKLDQSPEELANPIRLKDSSDRAVVLIKSDLPDDGKKLTRKQAEAMDAIVKKKKSS